MLKVRLSVLALASVVVTSHAGDFGFADSVVSYEPGVGYVMQYTNPAVALGKPSTVNPYGENTDVFDPPYGTNQIVSIGAGGSLTVKFETPILNHPHNRFGIDFIIFGNTGFIITNDFDFTTYNWIGTPATDGSIFGNNPGETRVSVSHDGRTFYVLNPAIAPTVDGLYPTDGSGDFHTPVDPTLTQADFSGLTLEGHSGFVLRVRWRDRVCHFLGTGRQGRAGEAEGNPLHPYRSAKRSLGSGRLFRRVHAAGPEPMS